MDKIFFNDIRNKVFSLMKDDSLLILYSREKVDGKYNVDRNFYYLTGLKEYNDVLVLWKRKGIQKEFIFINEYDEFKAKWVGRSLNNVEVENISGIINIYYLKEYDEMISRMLLTVENVYVVVDREKISSALTEQDFFVKDLRDKYPHLNIINSIPLFMKLRYIKSDEEVEVVKKAIDITNYGIKAIMENMSNCVYEYQAESYFDQAIKYNGATGFAFKSIAACGKNATCLHYSSNDSRLDTNSLALFDVGASYEMYSADITRTIPVSGKFTERQKQIYNIVLEGQQQVFERIKPGVTTKYLNDVLVSYYKGKLKEIGLIEKDSEVSKYYYHGVSHHLGLDCHDLADYSKSIEAGSIITVEPGLYIEEEDIGIRIEDDVLVKENGIEILSKNIIKTVEEIEDYMKRMRK